MPIRFPKLTDEPVAYSGAFKACLAALVLTGVVTLSGEQVAGLAVAFDALLACLVWPAVTPTTKALAAVDQAHDAGRNAGIADVASLAQVFPMQLDTIKTAPVKRAPAKKAPARRATGDAGISERLVLILVLIVIVVLAVATGHLAFNVG